MSATIIQTLLCYQGNASALVANFFNFQGPLVLTVVRQRHHLYIWFTLSLGKISAATHLQVQ